MEKNQKKIKFICLPGGGTSSVTFYKWFGILDSGYRPSFVDLPGRGLRKNETPLTTIEDITNDLYDGLLKIVEDGRDEDYVLFGYCMGAIFMYELYQRLLNEGKKLPIHLFVIAADIPDGDMYKENFITNPATKEQFYDLIKGCFPEHTFTDEVFLRKFRVAFVDILYKKYALDKDNYAVTMDDLKKAGSIEVEDSFELTECLKLANDLIHILGIDCNACCEYQNNPPKIKKINCPITCISGSEDLLYTEESMNQWSSITNKGFDYFKVNGGHRILLDKNQEAVSIFNDKLSSLRGA